MLCNDVTRRDFLKLATATAAMLAVPIVAESQQRLELTVEVDEAKLEQAISLKPWGGGCGVITEAIVYDYALTTGEIDEVHNYLANKYNLTLHAEIDTAKMWQAVHATDQWDRHWTTPDGKSWSCGQDSFTV